MYQAIPRMSGVFSPEVCDELNNALSKTNDTIEQFHPKALEHRFAISDISVTPRHSKVSVQNNSFQIEHEKWMSVIIQASEDIDCKDGVHVADIGVPCEGTIIFHLMEEGDISYRLVGSLEGAKLSVIHGKMRKGKRYLISFFFITANS